MKDKVSTEKGIWLSAAQSELETSLCQSQGISKRELMAAAAMAAFKVAIKRWPDTRHCLVLCGKGNNGGDGYRFACLARAAGWRVTLISAPYDRPLPEPAIHAQQQWVEGGGRCLEANAPWPDDIDLIVDALLGIGAVGQPAPPITALIRQINAHPAPCLALDLPSGLAADSGTVAGDVVSATATVCFLGLKPGLVTGQGKQYRGELCHADLGLSQLPATAPIEYLNAQVIPRWLTPRQATVHKGDMGKLAIIGGDAGTAGAVRLAGEAALRSGAGLVRVLTHESNLTPLLTARPELMSAELTAGTVAQALEWADIIAIGPGLGQSDWGKQALAQVRKSKKTMVWDADALNFLAIDPDKRQNRVLTPHPGEAARLLGLSVQEIEADRLSAANQLVNKYGGVVVLKGAGTIIASDQGARAIADVGNPGMASGGMGDLLTGMIAALLGQQLSLWNAACAGVVVHGAAADQIAACQGARGMLASDLFEYIRYWVNPDLQSG